MKPKRRLIVNVAAVVVVIAMTTLPTAQTRSTAPRRTSPLGPTSDSVLDMRDRDMNIRRLELEKENSKKRTLEVSKETIKQVSEDFGLIQKINSEIMRDYVAGTPPDYKHISVAMAEIRKRASRLQTNLLLPASDDIEGEPATAGVANKQPGRSPLVDLNDLIFSFVTNPIFKNENTIDLALGAKAKRDLAGIVNLSDRISRSAEKLSKSARASR